MNKTVSVFQFEIRYNHILNFSQVARTVLAPFIRLAQSLNIEHQNTVNEKIFLNFEDEDYLIIVNWDRIIIKGQQDLNAYTRINSPIQTPYLSILESIKALEGFGSIINVLLAVNQVCEIENVREENLLEHFGSKTLTNDCLKILGDKTDFALIIENRQPGDEKILEFGPYFGIKEIMKRPILPVAVDNLENVDFIGVMIETKLFRQTTEVNLDVFKSMVQESNDIVDKVCKTL